MNNNEKWEKFCNKLVPIINKRKKEILDKLREIKKCANEKEEDKKEKKKKEENKNVKTKKKISLKEKNEIKEENKNEIKKEKVEDKKEENKIEEEKEGEEDEEDKNEDNKNKIIIDEYFEFPTYVCYFYLKTKNETNKTFEDIYKQISKSAKKAIKNLSFTDIHEIDSGFQISSRERKKGKGTKGTKGTKAKNYYLKIENNELAIRKPDNYDRKSPQDSESTCFKITYLSLKQTLVKLKEQIDKKICEDNQNVEKDIDSNELYNDLFNAHHFHESSNIKSKNFDDNIFNFKRDIKKILEEIQQCHDDAKKIKEEIPKVKKEVKNSKNPSTLGTLAISSLYHKGKEISGRQSWGTNFLKKYEGFIKRSNLNLNIGNYDLYFEIKTNFMDWKKTKTPRPKNSGINREDAIRIVACYNIIVKENDVYLSDEQYFITNDHYGYFRKLKILDGVMNYDFEEKY